jgi:hypothetical protein
MTVKNEYHLTAYDIISREYIKTSKSTSSSGYSSMCLMHISKTPHSSISLLASALTVVSNEITDNELFLISILKSLRL